MATDWSEEYPTLELLKQTVTMVEVAEMLGLEPDSSGKIVSPWNPDERTPSCHLYEDHFHDFSTGKHGDIIDLVQAFDPEAKLNDVVRQVWTRALRAGKEPGDVERQPIREVVDFTEQLERLPIAHSIYPLFANLRPPTGCRAQGTDLLIPHADQDGVYGVKTRAPDGSKGAWPGSQFTKRLYDPYGWDPMDPTCGACVIAEGESDCWALDKVMPHATDRVFALPSGAQSWKDSWLEDLEPFDKVWLCMDNDKAGEAARDKLTRKIGFLKVEHLRVPQLYSDAREAIAAGWRPSL